MSSWSDVRKHLVRHCEGAKWRGISVRGLLVRAALDAGIAVQEASPLTEPQPWIPTPGFKEWIRARLDECGIPYVVPDVAEVGDPDKEEIDRLFDRIFATIRGVLSSREAAGSSFAVPAAPNVP